MSLVCQLAMPELYHPLAPGLEQLKERPQPRKVDLLVGGELKQHRAQLRPQQLRPLHEERDFVGYVQQPLDMGDVTARLDGKAKPLRSDLAPAEKHLRGGQPVKWIVQLHGGKAGRIIGELVPLFELEGVEHALPPVAVDVARGADPYFCPTGHVTIYRCSRASSGVKLRALSPEGPKTAGVSHVTAPKPEG